MLVSVIAESCNFLSLISCHGLLIAVLSSSDCLCYITIRDAGAGLTCNVSFYHVADNAVMSIVFVVQCYDEGLW